MCTFTLIAGWFRKLMGFGSGRNSQYSSNETSCESISTAMIDLIVAEVKAVYTVLAKRDLEIHRSQISLQSGGADYFWLVDKENLDQKLPEAKATELENLCYTLKADECNLILDEFRRRCLHCEKPNDAVLVFEQIVDETVKKRPHNSMNDWAMARIVKRRSVNSVTPGTICKFQSEGFVDFSNSRPSSSTSVSTGRSDPHHLATAVPPV